MDAHSFETIQHLPVLAHRDEILSAVDNNQVTIITAETGAGKSTQVPQFLAEDGYTKVIVTQPRILAARNLSERVRQEYSWRRGSDSSDLVGYRTAHERDDQPENVILYCTDGLQLVRELTGSGLRSDSGRQILVLDEIHEWNENMEVLIAWAKKRCHEDPEFRVVLMSATIEAGSLAAYFDNAPVIAIAGRSFNVEQRFGDDLIDEIQKQIAERTSNMLVFLPGKAEIENVGDAIASKAAAMNIPVIPLHSQLEPAQQQRAFENYPQGKIILTTNVAQTSITIDDIDTVIDSGLERRSEVRNGVEGLFIAQISQADSLQRAGRAGRTKPGLYVLAQYDTLPCLPLDKREPYGVPEILRKHIDRLVLRLANIDIDIEELNFYHSPSHRTIKQAKRTLVSLGAMTPAGTVTPIGRKMERFPVESSYARMLVEAEQYSAAIRTKLAAIIAIQEVGGIVKGGPRWTGWRKYSRQTRSDLIAQYDVFLALPAIPEQDHEELGIITKNVTKAQEVNERLNHDLGLDEVALTPVSDDETDQLLQSIVAGQLHQLWIVEPDGQAVHITDKSVREVSSGTVVKHAGLIAGIPFDLEVPTPKGLETLHLVNDITAIDPNWLEKLAPDLFSVRPGKIYYDSRYGTLAARTILTYAGKSLETTSMPVLAHTPANQQLFVTLYGKWLHEQLEKERRTVQSLNFRRIPAVPVRNIQSEVRQIAGGAVSLLELSKSQRIALAKLSRLDSYLDAHFMARLTTEPKKTQRRDRQSGGFPRQHHRGKPQKRKYDRRRDF
jgi:pre-mRNA-splicing factor ATP-dependent RNA helicase DHX38/PRP16